MLKTSLLTFAAFALLVTATAQQRGSIPASAILLDSADHNRAHLEAKREIAAVIEEVRPYLESRVRAGLSPSLPFIMPRFGLMMDSGGRAMWGNARPGQDDPLNLVFEGFTTPDQQLYQQLLQNTFNAAKPFLDSILGQPYVGGTIKVVNKDLAISDRDAVIGGLYLPDDGTGSQAIWFAIYLARETAVVNFIHCLALAYIGPAMFQYDVWGEGFARAATMQTVRLNGVPSGLNQAMLKQVLENAYDTSAHYSWYNQPALGNPRFIAPNLRDTPLPPGGSLGGLYLMRYRMGGTAWAKVLTEYPAFFSTFLSEYYAQFTSNPSIAGDIAGLKAIAQTTMDTLAGQSNATIEGRTFADWHRRQYIMDTAVTRGRKAFVESIPITSGLSDEDFGVFAIWLSYFDTLAGGNEQLLSGTCYPIFWDSTFARLFLTGQEDRMEIAAGFGSVTPNIVAVAEFGSDWYKATVELPVGDRMARAILPAGAIATAQAPVPKNFYGTVVGFDGFVTRGNPNLTGVVRLTIPATGQTVDAQLKNGAFGATVPAPGFSAPRRATVQVIRVDNSVETVLHTESVNTWDDTLGLDIRMNDEGTYVAPSGLNAGVGMFGLPIRPWQNDHAQVLNLPPNQTLLARWRQDLFRYELYPVISPFDWGRGFFVRMPSAVPNFSVQGIFPGDQPLSVPLQVGWNQIVNPFRSEISLSEVTVQRAAESPRLWNNAIAEGWIDTNMFEFVPGAPDPFSGLPEGGTMTPISAFPVGKAVYVRALVPEGVTITFRPGTSLAGMSANIPPPPTPTWSARLTARWGALESSRVEFGFVQGATNGYDVGRDCLLPPIWGGALQAEIVNATSMFRDFRTSGPQTWTVRLTGLRPGKTYTLTLQQTFTGIGPPALIVRDVERNRTWYPAIQRQYQFVATSSNRTLKVNALRGAR